MELPAEINDRVRRPAPEGGAVLTGSLPVVSFGDSLTATTATVALNPSWLEFQTKQGDWLLGAKRRLASLHSLGVRDSRDMDDAAVAQVVAESTNYFQGPNWYRGWFHWLESLLVASVDSSFLDGTACHLDLVQWATKPAQGALSAVEWERLVDDDQGFLRWQLTANRVERVLVNGATCARWMQASGLVDQWDEGVIEYLTTDGKTRRMRTFQAVQGGVTYVGWSTPLAQAISTTGRELLAAWVKKGATSPGDST